MIECWAAELGSCGRKQSGEHVITRALFAPSRNVIVRGLRWCLTEPLSIGLNSLKSNILCDVHNSALSPADQAADALQSTILEVDRIERLRLQSPRHRWSPKRRQVDGFPLERWFVKTALNLLTGAGDFSPWPLRGPRKVLPPRHLVDAAFGRSDLDEPLGLYAVARVGSNTGTLGHIGCGTLLDGNNQVAAAFYEFHGLRFLLWLSSAAIPLSPNPLESIDDWWGSELLRHPVAVRWERLGSLSQSIEFRWPTHRPPNKRVKRTRASRAQAQGSAM
jgi:hypothetical protein